MMHNIEKFATKFYKAAYFGLGDWYDKCSEIHQMLMHYFSYEYAQNPKQKFRDNIRLVYSTTLTVNDKELPVNIYVYGKLSDPAAFQFVGTGKNHFAFNPNLIYPEYNKDPNGFSRTLRSLIDHEVTHAKKFLLYFSHLDPFILENVIKKNVKRFKKWMKNPSTPKPQLINHPDIPPWILKEYVEGMTEYFAGHDELDAYINGIIRDMWDYGYCVNDNFMQKLHEAPQYKVVLEELEQRFPDKIKKLEKNIYIGLMQLIEREQDKISPYLQDMQEELVDILQSKTEPIDTTYSNFRRDLRMFDKQVVDDIFNKALQQAKTGDV